MSNNFSRAARVLSRQRLSLSPALRVHPCPPTCEGPPFTQQHQLSSPEDEEEEEQGLSQQGMNTPPLGQLSPQSMSALGLAPPQSPPTDLDDLDLSPIIGSPMKRCMSPPSPQGIDLRKKRTALNPPDAPKAIRRMITPPAMRAVLQDRRPSSVLEMPQFYRTSTPLSQIQRKAMKRTTNYPDPLVLNGEDFSEEEDQVIYSSSVETADQEDPPYRNQGAQSTSAEVDVQIVEKTTSDVPSASSARKEREITLRRNLMKVLRKGTYEMPPDQRTMECTGTMTPSQTIQNLEEYCLNDENWKHLGTPELEYRIAHVNSPSTPPIRVNPDMIRSSKKAVRWNAKNFLLTFPRNDTSKQTVADRLIHAYGDKLNWYLIAREAHQDGSPHLHVAICFKQRVDVRQHNFFDFLSENGFGTGANHCNIEVFRSPCGTVEYLQKSDPDPVTYGDVPKRSRSRPSSRSEASSSEGKPRKPKITHTIHQYFKSGKTLQDIDKEEDLGPFLMTNLAKLRDYQSWQQVMAAKLKGPGEAVTFHTTCIRSPCQSVVEWLEKNLNQPRRFKQKQLYLYGPPDTGKTTLLEKLRMHYRVFEMPSDDKRFNDWEDGAYDIAVMDEFKGQLPITFLNKFLDGQTMKLAALYSVGIQKKQNIPMIICSNFSVAQAYHNSSAEALLPLQIRLESIELDAEHKLDVDFITASAPEDDNGEQSSMHIEEP